MKTYITTIKGFSDPMRNVTNRTPAQRLGLFRSLAPVYAAGTWQAAREKMHAPDVSALSPGFNSKDYGVREDRYPVMVTHSGPQFRAEQWADECEEAGRTVEHSGWYSDADCSRTLRAFVFRLSRGRWGCGYADSDSGERVYLLEVHPDARSAARSADHEAQHYAEEEKEHNERWHAAQDLRDKIKESLYEIGRLFALRNHPRYGHDSRLDLMEEAQEVRNARAKLANDYADIDE
jgi:hypothetical protein